MPLGAALTRPELVKASHRLFVLDLVLDHALYHRELCLRQALVQEDAGAPRDQTKRGPQDHDPYQPRDDWVEDRPAGRESGYEPQGHTGGAPDVSAQVVPLGLERAESVSRATLRSQELTKRFTTAERTITPIPRPKSSSSAPFTMPFTAPKITHPPTPTSITPSKMPAKFSKRPWP